MKKLSDRKSRLTPISFYEKRGTNDYWIFQCSCGNEKVIRYSSYKSGISRSCGCMRIEVSTKHGHKKPNYTSPTYSSWKAMNTRCNNPNYPENHLYSRRNIKICDRWKDFKNFLEDMGERPEGKTLDRINNDGNYEPSNCRWACPSEQTDNRRCVRKVTFNNEIKTLRQWSKDLNLSRSILYRRIFVNKWDVKKAFLTEKKK